MKVFIACSYSRYVQEDGSVRPDFREWLEALISQVESMGHTVFNALKHDSYTINDADPAEAFKLDIDQLSTSDLILALLEDEASTGVQTEIGYAIALKKKVLLANKDAQPLRWFNQAIVKAGYASHIELPLKEEHFNL